MELFPLIFVRLKNLHNLGSPELALKDDIIFVNYDVI